MRDGVWMWERGQDEDGVGMVKRLRVRDGVWTRERGQDEG